MLMLEPASILMLEVSRWLQLCFQNRDAGLNQLNISLTWPAVSADMWQG